MIVDILYIIAGTGVALLNVILGVITWAMPDQVYDSLSWYFNHVKYLSGIIPITDLMHALSTYIGVLLLWYSFKIALMVLGYLPLGNKPSIPKLHKDE